MGGGSTRDRRGRGHRRPRTAVGFRADRRTRGSSVPVLGAAVRRGGDRRRWDRRRTGGGRAGCPLSSVDGRRRPRRIIGCTPRPHQGRPGRDGAVEAHSRLRRAIPRGNEFHRRSLATTIPSTVEGNRQTRCDRDARRARGTGLVGSTQCGPRFCPGASSCRA